MNIAHSSPSGGENLRGKGLELFKLLDDIYFENETGYIILNQSTDSTGGFDSCENCSMNKISKII